MIVILTQPETCASDPCVDENTEYCSDSNGSSEFKCVCHEGFDGIHCEYRCPLECTKYEICESEIDSSSIKKWKCINTQPIFPTVCEANPCCESGPTPLCCQNGVCSNDNFVFNATINNANECQCLCTDNFAGLFKYSHHIKTFNETGPTDCMCFMMSFLEI